MANKEQLTKAIGAHGMWKQRLHQAIETGKSEFTVDRVRPDNICDFGKWLYSLAPADKQSAHWKAVQEMHAKFHAEAASVLDSALKGQKQKAESAMGVGSEFAKTSSALTASLMKWTSAIP